jgi:hypothetical protein
MRQTKISASAIAVFMVVMVLGPSTANPQVTRQQRITADDARPMLEVLNRLEAMYGWEVTYEDPAYENERDILDRSDATFRQEHAGGRLLIPAGRRFEFTFDVPAGSKPPDAEQVLRELLLRHEGSGNPGIFRLSRTWSTWHIEPAKVLRHDGQIVASHSILDTRITFPRARRTSLETLRLVLSSVSQTTGTSLQPGIIGVNLLQQSTSEEGPENEAAKNVLVRLFEDVNKYAVSLINEPRHTVWQIMYDPGSKVYFFHTHVVTIEEDSPVGGKRRRPI